MRFASATEPVAFDASANATTRVRSPSLPLEVVVVDGELVGRADDVHRRAPCRRRARPTGRRRRRDRAAVVTISSPARKSRAGRAREREVERRHVHAERDLVGGAAEEARGVLLRPLEDRLDRAAGRIRRAEVARRLAQGVARSPARPRRAPASRPARRRRRSPSWSEEKRLAHRVDVHGVSPDEDPAEHGGVDVPARDDADDLLAPATRPRDGRGDRERAGALRRSRASARRAAARRRPTSSSGSANAPSSELRGVRPDAAGSARGCPSRRRTTARSRPRSARRRRASPATGAPVSGSAA